MMRKALLVGIDDYRHAPLASCGPGAEGLARILAQNEDGSPNFSMRVLVSGERAISRSALL